MPTLRVIYEPCLALELKYRNGRVFRRFKVRNREMKLSKTVRQKPERLRLSGKKKRGGGGGRRELSSVRSVKSSRESHASQDQVDQSHNYLNMAHAWLEV